MNLVVFLCPVSESISKQIHRQDLFQPKTETRLTHEPLQRRDTLPDPKLAFSHPLPFYLTLDLVFPTKCQIH